MSWNVPWWDKTVVRAGYGISYSGALRNYIGVGGEFSHPECIWEARITESLRAVRLHDAIDGGAAHPQPLTTALQPIPYTDRTLQLQVYDQISPYIQNFDVKIQHAIFRNTIVDVRYVGTKGTKLWGSTELNSVDIFNNGILTAFNRTRAGQDAALFDQMLTGINIGSGVIGTTTTVRQRCAPMRRHGRLLQTVM